jgi:PHD/YefM family antitoxin component YafN of YafNO toxin-antitoxin module
MKKISASFAQQNLNKIMDFANDTKQDIAISYNKKNIIMMSAKKIQKTKKSN